MKRRQFIQLIAATSLSGCAASESDSGALLITKSQTEGPYYPVEPIPANNNLLLNDQFLGRKLELYGVVHNEQGTPLENAKVEIWQCDGQGVYDHPIAPDTDSFDANFTGRGATYTTVNGEYEFTTIVPVPYTGRPPHIHTKVFYAESERLTSQIYLQDSGGQSSLQIKLIENTQATYRAQFDFVINT